MNRYVIVNNDSGAYFSGFDYGKDCSLWDNNPVIFGDWEIDGLKNVVNNLVNRGYSIRCQRVKFEEVEEEVSVNPLAFLS